MRKQICPPPETDNGLSATRKAISKGLRRSLRLIGPASTNMSRPSQNGSKEFDRAGKDSNGRARSASRNGSNTATPSFASLLSNPQQFEEATHALDHITGILLYINRYPKFVKDVDKVHGRCIAQDAEIQQLRQQLETVTLFKDHEARQVLKENNRYKEKEETFEAQRLDLEDRLMNFEAEIKAKETQLREEAEKDRAQVRANDKKLLQEHRERLKEQATRAIDSAKNESTLEIQNLNSKAMELRRENEILARTNEQQKQAWDNEVSELQCVNRSHLERIKSLEAKVQSVTTINTIVPQTTEFYDRNFDKLNKLISDVGDLIELPEDTLTSWPEPILQQLKIATEIFKYATFDSERPATSFLRACGLQHYIAATVFSVISCPYLAISSDGVPATDKVFEALSQVQCENSFHELVWKQITVQKLDRLDMSHHGPPISDQSRLADILGMLNKTLRYFVITSETSTKLDQLAGLVLELWNALRRDRCQLHIEFDPSLSPTQDWIWAYFNAEDPATQASAPGRELPSRSFALFPRITILADEESTTPHVSSRGLALLGSSPAFLISHHEDEAMKAEVKRVRRGTSISYSAQSSPVLVTQPIPLLSQGGNNQG